MSSHKRRLIDIVAAIALFIGAASARAAQPPQPYPPGFGTQEAWIQTMLHLLYTGGVGGVLQVNGARSFTAAQSPAITSLSLGGATLGPTHWRSQEPQSSAAPSASGQRT